MIRALVYLSVAIALLATTMPAPFPFLLVAGFVALGALGVHDERSKR